MNIATKYIGCCRMEIVGEKIRYDQVNFAIGRNPSYSV
jgi:hypothetical protein